MRFLSALLLVAASISATPAQAHTAPIVNYENQAIKRFDNKVLTLDEVQRGIRDAAGKLGWRVEPGEPGHIIATLVVRQHTAVVDISYTQTSYSIVYKSSVNLDYAGADAKAPSPEEDIRFPVRTTPVIHGNYNKWVQQLNDAIFRRLQE